MYALLQLLLQVLYLTYFVIAVLSAELGNKALAGAAQSALSKYVIDAMSLSAPICLFTTRYIPHGPQTQVLSFFSKAVRQAYVGMFLSGQWRSIAASRFAWMSSTHSAA